MNICIPLHNFDTHETDCGDRFLDFGELVETWSIVIVASKAKFDTPPLEFWIEDFGLCIACKFFRIKIGIFKCLRYRKNK